MTQYVYPAVFHPNNDGSITVTFPDLPGCITEGKSLENALFMAQDALSVWLEYTIDHKEPVPEATAFQDMRVEGAEFVNLIRAEVRDNRAVRRTVSIPKWMDDMVADAGLSLSRVLQDALKARLKIN